MGPQSSLKFIDEGFLNIFAILHMYVSVSVCLFTLLSEGQCSAFRAKKIGVNYITFCCDGKYG